MGVETLVCICEEVGVKVEPFDSCYYLLDL